MSDDHAAFSRVDFVLGISVGFFLCNLFWFLFLLLLEVFLQLLGVD